MMVARGMYALSKRTDLYLAGAHVKGKHGQLVGLSRDDAGIRHFAERRHRRHPAPLLILRRRLPP